VNVDRPDGKVVTLPVANIAAYPFSWECYRVEVGGEPQEDGLINIIYYGFTEASAAEFSQETPWYDITDFPVAEGMLFPDTRLEAIPSMTTLMDPQFVRVPADRNVVYRLQLIQFGGTCGTDGDSTLRGNKDSRVYFYEVGG
jgi:hypothetical protein